MKSHFLKRTIVLSKTWDQSASTFYAHHAYYSFSWPIMADHQLHFIGNLQGKYDGQKRVPEILKRTMTLVMNK